VVELLLANKADINPWDKDHRTPLWLAMLKGHKDLAEWMRQQGGHE
jgi:ankyrin repeat protein